MFNNFCIIRVRERSLRCKETTRRRLLGPKKQRAISDPNESLMTVRDLDSHFIKIYNTQLRRSLSLHFAAFHNMVNIPSNALSYTNRFFNRFEICSM